MQPTITVRAKVIGRSRPPFADWSIPVPPDWLGGDHLTLRDLITRIVCEEVEGFRTRQEERKLTRVLSKAEIESATAKGKVDMGGRSLDQEVDPDAAVGAALQAFEDRLYLVILDGVQQQELDREVYLRPGSEVNFVRLVPLAGG